MCGSKLLCQLCFVYVCERFGIRFLVGGTVSDAPFITCLSLTTNRTDDQRQKNKVKEQQISFVYHTFPYGPELSGRVDLDWEIVRQNRLVPGGPLKNRIDPHGVRFVKKAVSFAGFKDDVGTLSNLWVAVKEFPAGKTEVIGRVDH